MGQSNISCDNQLHVNGDQDINDVIMDEKFSTLWSEEERVAFNILKAQPTSRREEVIHQHHDITTLEALDSAVYKKLRIGCELPEEVESCIPFQWRNQETLAEFVERVYKPSPESGSVQPIDINNVRAKVLRKRASIKIRSTNILSDHLYLHIGKRFKILYLFPDRGFLEDSLSGLSVSNQTPTHSPTEALSR